MGAEVERVAGCGYRAMKGADGGFFQSVCEALCSRVGVASCCGGFFTRSSGPLTCKLTRKSYNYDWMYKFHMTTHTWTELNKSLPPNNVSAAGTCLTNLWFYIGSCSPLHTSSKLELWCRKAPLIGGRKQDQSHFHFT